MSNPQADHEDQEPTMEEILSSIKKIISDDDQEDGANDSSKALKSKKKETSSSGNNDEEDSNFNPNDILDLTNMVLDDGSRVKLDKEGNPENNNMGKTKSNENSKTDLDPALKSKLDALGLIGSSESKNLGSNLIDSLTADTAAAAFAQLASTRAEKATTLEELVKELLRPMLKAWLDENLAQLVGRVVEREVTKLSGKAEE